MQEREAKKEQIGSESENGAVRLEMHHARFWLRWFSVHAPHLFDEAVALGVDPELRGSPEPHSTFFFHSIEMRSESEDPPRERAAPCAAGERGGAHTRPARPALLRHGGSPLGHGAVPVRPPQPDVDVLGAALEEVHLQALPLAAASGEHRKNVPGSGNDMWYITARGVRSWPRGEGPDLRGLTGSVQPPPAECACGERAGPRCVAELLAPAGV